MHSIKKIVEVNPFKLKLQFENGEIKLIDLEPRLRRRSQSVESKYKDLLDEKYFSTVKLHPEWQTIYWDNGIDLCPDVLFMEGESKN